MDVVIITPEPGLAKEIGQKLLALATSPYDVNWVTWPQAGYSVPLELFVRFDADGDKATGGILKNPMTIGEDSPPPLESPRPRRGRPRKDSTDNNTSEEE